jgi:hypothetical protein
MWTCRCACGRVKDLCKAQLIRTRSPQCSECWRKNAPGQIPTHGEARHGKESPEYIVWLSMRARCTNVNNKRYHRYGGRGISICKRWELYSNFLEDMGRRPSPKHSLERINNDRNYTPSNCKWATGKEQGRNTSTNTHLTVNGETRVMAEWAELMGLKQNTLAMRINSYGWSHERAVTEPVHSTRWKY